MGKKSSKKSETKSGVKGLKFKKTHGQHILKNPGIVTKIIEKSNIKPNDVVMEIGPGTGNLTQKILEKAYRVLAFEIDPRMVAELQKRVMGTHFQKKLQVHCNDVVRETAWPKFDLLISNLPYQISSPFINRLITHKQSYRAAVVMLQKEFADRLIARPGDKCYGRLSVRSQLYLKTAHLVTVGRNNFRPPPKVDSSIVRIEKRHPQPPINDAEFDGLLRIVFARKNRTIRKCFANRTVLRNLLSLRARRDPQQRMAGELAGSSEDCDDAITEIEADAEEDEEDEDKGEEEGDGDEEGREAEFEPDKEENDGLSEMWRQIQSVLERFKMSGKRARTLEEDDFLRLYLELKRAGMYFS